MWIIYIKMDDTIKDSLLMQELDMFTSLLHMGGQDAYIEALQKVVGEAEKVLLENHKLIREVKGKERSCSDDGSLMKQEPIDHYNKHPPLRR